MVKDILGKESLCHTNRAQSLDAFEACRQAQPGVFTIIHVPSTCQPDVPWKLDRTLIPSTVTTSLCKAGRLQALSGSFFPLWGKGDAREEEWPGKTIFPSFLHVPQTPVRSGSPFSVFSQCSVL